MSCIKSVNIFTRDMLPNFDENYVQINNSIYKKENYNASTINSDISSINSDSIEISEKNENVINSKKAYNTFQDSISELHPELDDTLPDYINDINLKFVILRDKMESNGLSVPSFNLSNTTDFLHFLDSMKEFSN